VPFDMLLLDATIPELRNTKTFFYQPYRLPIAFYQQSKAKQTKQKPETVYESKNAIL
jgi:hypothetical protein